MSITPSGHPRVSQQTPTTAVQPKESSNASQALKDEIDGLLGFVSEGDKEKFLRNLFRTLELAQIAPDHELQKLKRLYLPTSQPELCGTTPSNQGLVGAAIFYQANTYSDPESLRMSGATQQRFNLSINGEEPREPFDINVILNSVNLANLGQSTDEANRVYRGFETLNAILRLKEPKSLAFLNFLIDKRFKFQRMLQIALSRGSLDYLRKKLGAGQ
jgi:hypothetical protein